MNPSISVAVPPESTTPVELLGEIVAGRPGGGVEGRTEACIPIDFEALDIARNARCFALRVRGDSMIDAHIMEGDLVVLELRTPHHGAIVAALIDGEAVLKRYLVKNGKPYLKSENSNYPKLVPVNELMIQGVLRAVVRKAGA